MAYVKAMETFFFGIGSYLFLFIRNTYIHALRIVQVCHQ